MEQPRATLQGRSFIPLFVLALQPVNAAVLQELPMKDWVPGLLWRPRPTGVQVSYGVTLACVLHTSSNALFISTNGKINLMREEIFYTQTMKLDPARPGAATWRAPCPDAEVWLHCAVTSAAVAAPVFVFSSAQGIRSPWLLRSVWMQKVCWVLAASRGFL